jgi:hypothetical protein
MLLLFLVGFPFLSGLQSPDGLWAAGETIYLSEETAGRVLCITANGQTSVAAEGLSSPEGVCVDDSGRILAVEDTSSGRLVQITDGVCVTLADNLDCPEGVTVDRNGVIWFTTGGFQAGKVFTSIWQMQNGEPVRAYSLPSVFSFSDIEAADDGNIYVCSESSGIVGDVAVFRFNPYICLLTPFVTGVTACEGIGLTNGGFPMYLTGESGSIFSVDSTGACSLIQDNLSTVEDVLVWHGQIYVSEDGTGSLIRLDAYE